MNEKGAVGRVRTLSQVPEQFAERVNMLFEQLAPDGARLAAALKGLEPPVRETEALLRR